MIPERTVSGECGQCGWYRTEYVKCAICNVVRYCNHEHMISHQDLHQNQCEEICTMLQQYREQLDGERGELILRTQRGIQLPYSAQVIDTHATEYMFAYFCVKHLFKKKLSLEGVRTEITQFQMFAEGYLVNPVYSRRMIPSRLLARGEDELCYDFIQQGIRSERRKDLAGGVVEAGLGYRDSKGEDPLKDEDFFLMEGIDPYFPDAELIQTSAVIFLKVRIYLELQALKEVANTVGRFLPREILTKVKYFTATSWYIRESRHLLEMDDPKEALVVLLNQVEMLYHRVDNRNPHLWPYLVFEILPGSGKNRFEASHGSAHEVVAKDSSLWVSLPGALEFMANMMRRLSPDEYQGCRARTSAMQMIEAIPSRQYIE